MRPKALPLHGVCRVPGFGTRIRAIAICIALSGGALGCSEEERNASEAPPSFLLAPTAVTDAPSIIVITIDTLRRDHLSLYGYPRPTTPALDALAVESIVFERAVATSPWTKPSTASLFTGLHTSEHGAYGEFKVRPGLRFLAEVLREHGYATAAFSGNPYVSPSYGLDPGFTRFDSMGGQTPKDYVDIRKILEKARFWLDAWGEEPIFLYLHTMNVHGPYRAPAEYRERFLDGPHESFPFRNPIWIDIAERQRVERGSEVTDAHLRDLAAHYDGAIAYTDAMLGGFVEDLRLRGILDRSLLVITSDHGEELFDHGSFGHRRSLHAELVDIPLLLRLPGGRQGGLRISEPVSLIDLPITLLDLADALDREPGRRFGRGQSLAPLLAEAREPGPARALMAELINRPEPSTMLELWPHRLIQMSGDHSARLYRVDEDPGETRNLAEQAPAIVEALAERARTLRQEGGGAHGTGEKVPREGELRSQLEALGYIGEAGD